ncbi:MAG: PDZ domain-containing protein [Deltaproteobacteria bacterium]|nr:PDZ domain-containing protein [Deltaproteobacteria bacterium]
MGVLAARIGLGAILVGGLFGWLSSGWGRDGALRAQIAELEVALEEEKSARIDLSGEVARLREELVIWEGLLEGFAPDDEARDATLAEVDLEAAAAEAKAKAERGAGAPAQSSAGEGKLPPWFDTDQLLAGGMSERDAERLKLRWEKYQMDLLYLSDQLKRAGGSTSAEHRRGRQELSRELQEDLSDDEYDCLLAASGQPNRVRVQEILSQSPGYEAGLQKGDFILSYNGMPVFRPGDLKNAITASRSEDLVPIEVRSASGQYDRFHIRAGPIGIQMMPARSGCS